MTSEIKNERRFATLDKPEEIKQLVVDAWDNQDSVLIEPYEINKVTYVSIVEDLNDNYHGQGILVKAKNYSSIFDFIPGVIDVFGIMREESKYLPSTSIEKAELIDRLNKILTHLDSILS